MMVSPTPYKSLVVRSNLNHLGSGEKDALLFVLSGDDDSPLNTDSDTTSMMGTHLVSCLFFPAVYSPCESCWPVTISILMLIILLSVVLWRTTRMVISSIVWTLVRRTISLLMNMVI